MKNLIVCSDGTGNRGGKSHGTNVWRLMQAVDRDHPETQQISYYDDGVGTEQFKWLKLLGGAFGWGLSRNLCELYRFIVLNFDREAGDKLFLFGFSRGAFTVRALAGMIDRCGLLEKQDLLAAENKRTLLKQILNAYRSVERSEVDDLRQRYHFNPVEIECIGVWDTVDAIGCPDEIRSWLDPMWQKFTGRRLYGFSQANKLAHSVRHGYQALSIDDERQTFHPNLWGPRDGVEQVWFAGVHSNVGGGYPKNGMALVSLDWMLGKVEQLGVKFLALNKQQIREQADVHAKLYDSRSGLGTLYRYRPRELGTLPHLHISVYERIFRKSELYAPYVIPEDARLAYSHEGPYSRTVAITPMCDLDGVEKEQLQQLVEERIRANRALIGVVAVVLIAGVWIALTAEHSGPETRNWLTGVLTFLFAGLPDGIAALIVDNWHLSLPVAGVLAWLLKRSRDARFKIRDLMLTKWDQACQVEQPKRPVAPADDDQETNSGKGSAV